MLHFLKKKEELFLYPPQMGKVVGIEQVPDAAFSSKMMGEGFAVIPEGDEIFSPASGTISVVTEPSLHAYGITTDDGLELLVHVGIDTVGMNGEGFTTCVIPGEHVKCGQLLGSANHALISQKGFDTHIIVVITNSQRLQSFKINREVVTDVHAGLFQYALKK